MHSKSNARTSAAAGLLLLLCRLGAGDTTHAAWPNAMKPKGTPGPVLTLVKDGRGAFAVLVPVKPTTVEKKAAEELQHWVKEITGATLQIVNDSEAATGLKLVSIGSTAIAGDADGNLRDDGYEIAVKDGHLLLRGGAGRGVVNAVYALLEEDVGCRWYAKDSVRLPRSTTLTFAPVPRRYTPRLRLRDPFYAVSFDETWSLRNRTSAPQAAVREEWGGRFDYGGLFVHTHAALLPPDPHFKDHPDWFAMNAAGQRYAAQLCPTHPDVARVVTGNVLKALKDNPHAEAVSVSKNDNAGDQFCHCEKCKELRADEGGTDMANQLFLVNQVAEAVERQYPRVAVDTLAYLETIQVPKRIRPRKNVVIRLCNDTVGAWAKPFTPARRLPVAEVIKRWSAAHDRLSVWDYNVNFSHYLAPMPNLDVIADNIRFWVGNKAEGLMTQGGYQGAAERDELKSWVIAKLMWDPSLDEKALVDDFIVGHYGKAAPAMAEYEALLGGLREKHAAAMASPPGGIRYPMDAPFLSKEFLDRASELVARAAKLAGGDEALLRRVERAELPVLYVRLSRGPQFVGDGYTGLVGRFERIARREGATHMAEVSPADLDARVAAWRKSSGTP
jgi:hypothetical protein